GRGVVSEPGPAVAHRVGGSRGQVLQGGIAAQEARVVPHHARHLRLLEHELGDQDRVGIARSAPRQRAPMPGIPAQQAPAESVHALRERKRFLLPPRTATNYTRHRCAGCVARFFRLPPAPSRDGARATITSCRTLSVCCARPSTKATCSWWTASNGSAR